MKINHSRPSIIFLIIGILLIGLSFAFSLITDPTFWNDFCSPLAQNLGIILLTVVVLEYFWGLLGGDPLNNAVLELRTTLQEMRSSVNLLAESKTSGLERINATSGAFGTPAEWMERLKSAKQAVDLMGYTLHIWNNGQFFQNELIKLARNDVKVRILIMDETNPDLESFINADQIPAISTELIKVQIKNVKNVFTKVELKLTDFGKNDNFEFRTLKKGMIVCQLCRTDVELTMIQYLFSVTTSESPIMQIHGQNGKLFETYTGEFEKMWELAGINASTNSHSPLSNTEKTASDQQNADLAAENPQINKKIHAAVVISDSDKILSATQQK